MKKAVSTIFADVMNSIDRVIKVRTKDRRGDLSLSALRLVFLKYAIDNHIGAKTFEDMEMYSEIQRSLSSHDGKRTLDLISKVFVLVESLYGLKNILNNDAIISEYKNDIPLIQETKETVKYTPSEELKKKYFQDILEALSSADLRDDNEKTVGRSIVDIFMSSITMTSRWNKAASELTSGVSVALAGKEILQVKSDDTFLDFFAGIGKTTIFITRECDPGIINIDRDAVACCANAMLLILDGHTKLDIRCVEDSLDMNFFNIKANKIFVDYPCENMDNMKKIIGKSLNSLEDKAGKCVITVSKKFLIAMDQDTMEYKKRLSESCKLESVIRLDNAYLLVLGENRTNGIVFKMESGERLISSEKLGIYDKKNDLRSYDLLPELYVKENKPKTSMEEIELEVKHAYDQLKKYPSAIVPVKEIDEEIEKIENSAYK